MLPRAIIGLAAWLLAATLRATLPPAPVPPAPHAPSAAALEALALGRSTTAATLAWARIVARFADQAPGEGDADWLEPALQPVYTLDPRWSLPWSYGALMARHLGDPPTEERLLRLGMAQFPQAHWFPYALGMALYLEQGDRAEAARWLKHASTLPGAPPSYAEAARQLRKGSPP